jgi:hypothetical protein
VGQRAAALQDSAHIERLEADGTWAPSNTTVEQLYDATLDKLDVAEAHESRRRSA